MLLLRERERERAYSDKSHHGREHLLPTQVRAKTQAGEELVCGLAGSAARQNDGQRQLHAERRDKCVLVAVQLREKVDRKLATSRAGPVGVVIGRVCLHCADFGVSECSAGVRPG
jgi:hypothetical protein